MSPGVIHDASSVVLCQPVDSLMAPGVIHVASSVILCQPVDSTIVPRVTHDASSVVLCQPVDSMMAPGVVQDSAGVDTLPFFHVSDALLSLMYRHTRTNRMQHLPSNLFTSLIPDPVIGLLNPPSPHQLCVATAKRFCERFNLPDQLGRFVEMPLASSVSDAQDFQRALRDAVDISLLPDDDISLTSVSPVPPCPTSPAMVTSPPVPSPPPPDHCLPQTPVSPVVSLSSTPSLLVSPPISLAQRSEPTHTGALLLPVHHYSISPSICLEQLPALEEYVENEEEACATATESVVLLSSTLSPLVSPSNSLPQEPTHAGAPPGQSGEATGDPPPKEEIHLPTRCLISALHCHIVSDLNSTTRMDEIDLFPASPTTIVADDSQQLTLAPSPPPLLQLIHHNSISTPFISLAQPPFLGDVENPLRPEVVDPSIEVVLEGVTGLYLLPSITRSLPLYLDMYRLPSLDASPYAVVSYPNVGNATTNRFILKLLLSLGMRWRTRRLTLILLSQICSLLAGIDAACFKLLFVATIIFASKLIGPPICIYDFATLIDLDDEAIVIIFALERLLLRVSFSMRFQTREASWPDPQVHTNSIENTSSPYLPSPLDEPAAVMDLRVPVDGIQTCLSMLTPDLPRIVSLPRSEMPSPVYHALLVFTTVKVTVHPIGRSFILRSRLCDLVAFILWRVLQLANLPTATHASFRLLFGGRDVDLDTVLGSLTSHDPSLCLSFSVVARVRAGMPPKKPSPKPTIPATQKIESLPSGFPLLRNPAPYRCHINAAIHALITFGFPKWDDFLRDRFIAAFDVSLGFCDAGEVVAKLLDIFLHVLGHRFRVLYECTLKCSFCSSSSTSVNEQYQLVLSPQHITSDSLKLAMARKTSTIHQAVCPEHGCQNVSLLSCSSISVCAETSALCVQMARKNGGRGSNKTNFEVSLDIVLDGIPFVLRSAIIFTGADGHGHYVSLVHLGYSWFEIDGTVAKRSSSSAVGLGSIFFYDRSDVFEVSPYLRDLPQPLHDCNPSSIDEVIDVESRRRSTLSSNHHDELSHMLWSLNPETLHQGVILCTESVAPHMVIDDTSSSLDKILLPLDNSPLWSPLDDGSLPAPGLVPLPCSPPTSMCSSPSDHISVPSGKSSEHQQKSFLEVCLSSTQVRVKYASLERKLEKPVSQSAPVTPVYEIVSDDTSLNLPIGSSVPSSIDYHPADEKDTMLNDAKESSSNTEACDAEALLSVPELSTAVGVNLTTPLPVLDSNDEEKSASTPLQGTGVKRLRGRQSPATTTSGEQSCRRLRKKSRFSLNQFAQLAKGSGMVNHNNVGPKRLEIRGRKELRRQESRARLELANRFKKLCLSIGVKRRRIKHSPSSTSTGQASLRMYPPGNKRRFRRHRTRADIRVKRLAEEASLLDDSINHSANSPLPFDPQSVLRSGSKRKRKSPSSSPSSSAKLRRQKRRLADSPVISASSRCSRIDRLRSFLLSPKLSPVSHNSEPNNTPSWVTYAKDLCDFDISSVALNDGITTSWHNGKQAFVWIGKIVEITDKELRIIYSDGDDIEESFIPPRLPHLIITKIEFYAKDMGVFTRERRMSSAVVPDTALPRTIPLSIGFEFEHPATVSETIQSPPICSPILVSSNSPIAANAALPSNSGFRLADSLSVAASSHRKPRPKKGAKSKAKSAIGKHCPSKKDNVPNLPCVEENPPNASFIVQSEVLSQQFAPNLPSLSTAVFPPSYDCAQSFSHDDDVGSSLKSCSPMPLSGNVGPECVLKVPEVVLRPAHVSSALPSKCAASILRSSLSKSPDSSTSPPTSTNASFGGGGTSKLSSSDPTLKPDLRCNRHLSDEQVSSVIAPLKVNDTVLVVWAYAEPMNKGAPQRSWQGVITKKGKIFGELCVDISYPDRKHCSSLPCAGTRVYSITRLVAAPPVYRLPVVSAAVQPSASLYSDVIFFKGMTNNSPGTGAAALVCIGEQNIDSVESHAEILGKRVAAHVVDLIAGLAALRKAAELASSGRKPIVMTDREAPYLLFTGHQTCRERRLDDIVREGKSIIANHVIPLHFFSRQSSFLASEKCSKGNPAESVASASLLTLKNIGNSALFAGHAEALVYDVPPKPSQQNCRKHFHRSQPSGPKVKPTLNAPEGPQGVTGPRSFEEFLALRKKRARKTVPAALWVPWSEMVAVYTNRIVAAPTADTFAAAFLDLLALPSMYLPIGRSEKDIKNAMNMRTPFLPKINKLARVVTSEEEKLVRRAVKLAEEGFVSRAVRSLSPSPVADCSDKLIQNALKKLHPERQSAAEPCTTSAIPLVSPDTLLDRLKRFSNGAASSISWWSKELLLAAARTSDIVLQGLCVMCKRLLELPEAPPTPLVTLLRRCLIASRLIALQKKGHSAANPKIRPIAICELFLKLLSSLAEHDVQSHLPSWQKGCGTRSGAEINIHTLREAFLAGDALLLLDSQNAFNTMFRSEIRAWVEDEGSAIQSAFFNLAYQPLSDLVVFGSNPTDPHQLFYSADGVKQGCIAALRMFCGTLGRKIDPILQEENSPAGFCAFVDDLAAHDSDPLILLSFLVRLLTPLRELGLEINMSKSFLLLHNNQFTEEIMALAAELGVTTVSESEYVDYLGSFIGATSSCEKAALDVVEKHSDFFDLLGSGKLPTHLSYLFLTLSGLPKLDYILRSTPPDITRAAANLFDTKIKQCFDNIVGAEVDDFHRQQ